MNTSGIIGLPNHSFPVLLLRLWDQFSSRRRLQLAGLLALMLANSAAEVFSLAMVLPFLSVLTDPGNVWSRPVVQQVGYRLGMTSATQLLLPITALFCLAAIVSGSVRLLNLSVSGRLAASIGSDLSCEAYQRTLYQPYEVHLARNSSVVITALQAQVGSLVAVLNSILACIANSLLLINLLLALMVIDAKVALATGSVLGLAYGAIARVSKSRLDINSRLSASYSRSSLQSLQEGLGSIRDVLLDRSQPTYLDIYRQSDRPLRQLAAQSSFVSIFPRYIMEALGISVIGIVAYSLSSSNGGMSNALPLMGALALGAQRVLPSIQLLYSSWASIQANKAAVEDVVATLIQPLPEGSGIDVAVKLSFRESIKFDAVDFTYSSGGPQILTRLGFEILKGQRVGFIGATGSGKSTTIDLLMGLLEPSNGTIYVDGKNIHASEHPHRLLSWRATISHVPQMVYLADRSIAENIAFGSSAGELDMPRVREAAEHAQILSFIESMPDGFQSFVGERGVRLSGGQRQRIGIARALYKRADVLVFDEATSALDNATEAALMDAIKGLSRELTIVMIAHRLTTVERCDRVIELSNGSVLAITKPSVILI